MAITRQDIWAAADALDAEGVRPTLSAVRKRVGGGSFTTISEAMGEWKTKQPGAVEHREPPPPVLLDRMAEAAADLWGLALEAAQARLAAEREQMATERAEVERRYSETAELAATISAELEQLQGVAAERDRLTQELAAGAAERERLIDQVKRLDAELTQARQEARAGIERAARTEGELAASKEQLTELREIIRGFGQRPDGEARNPSQPG